MTSAGPSGGEWWRRAALYEVYLRSFADGDGDGVGDLAGLRARLPYLRELGVDAVWVTPWYPSPFADGGYDVADYREIDRVFGTLADADALVAEAHALGIRVLADIVPNHTSEAHPWFVEALAAGPGSPARGRYLFRDGRGDGSLPPNDWRSAFGGPAWTRVTEADGSPGQWYLHLFAPEQPDLDWTNQEVREEFESILGFWFDRGIDGFRIDVAHALAKARGLPDLGYPAGSKSAWGAMIQPWEVESHPHWDVDDVHEIFQGWRAVADDYGDRLLLAEAIVGVPERIARYVGLGRLQTAFGFPFMHSRWDAQELRSVIDETLAAFGAAGAPPVWLLSSHDETRHVTRFGRSETAVLGLFGETGEPTDLGLGARRARAAALLVLALPGIACLYQGEELGLGEVEDLPPEERRDPAWRRSGGTVRGRDGCRVPLPWSGAEPPFGFGPAGSTPWLPQPAAWRGLTVEAQEDDPASLLALYRRALRLRRSHEGFAGDSFRWLDAPAGVLHFERDSGVRCAVNLGEAPSELLQGGEVLLASAELGPGSLPPDAAAYYTVPS
ncbi:MAG TPA: glycoside hydrolase family 13 protein [Gaiellaceae bacterium]|nr:glycoside hydrolase family 13 protein [Gaiellaceae bacterium]